MLATSRFVTHIVRRLTVPALAVLCCALAGCGVINDDEEDTTFHVRGLNLIANAPSLEFYLGDTLVATAGYGESPASHAGPGGSHATSLQAVRAAPLITDSDADDDEDDSYAVGQSVDYTFAGRTDYTLVAYGDLSAPQLFLAQIPEPQDLGNNRIAWQILQAAPNFQTADVYITAPLADISTATYAATVSFQQQTNFAELTVHADPDLVDETDDDALYADFTIELRAAGTDQRLCRFEGLRVTEKNRVQLVIADTDGPGPAHVQLIVLRSDGTSEVLQDADNDTQVRFVHVSHDTPSLDVLSGSSFQTPIAQNIGFRGFSSYVNVANGKVDLIGVPTGNPSVSSIAFAEGFTALANQHYSAYAIGQLADDLDATLLTDTVRSVARQGSVRFLHASHSLRDESLDVYLTLPGQAIDFTSDDDDASGDDEDDDDETLRRGTLAYRGNIGYFTGLPGEFDVQFYRSGTSIRLIGPLRFQITDGKVQTWVLADSEAGVPELLAVDDAAATP